MKFLVIKHISAEGLGIFEQFIRGAGIDLDIVEIEKNDPFPSMEGYSALWVMGGPMNVGDEELYPWLIAEKALIREAIQDRNLPYMGICLGAQLLAEALDGEVGPMPTPEVGLLDVSLTKSGFNHPFMVGLPSTFKVLQWHAQEVKRLPARSTLLASSPGCKIQAYAVADRAFGLQFHSEVTPQIVKDWSKIPAYETDLQAIIGPSGCDILERAVIERAEVMKEEARTIFENFLKIVTETPKIIENNQL